MDNFFEKLKDPRFFKENRIYPHSDHIVYAPEDECRTDTALDDPDRFGKGSSFRKYLNGDWKFQYAVNFAQAPSGFEAPGYPEDGWIDIKVPGHIQLQGFDTPQYVNIQYPWDGREEISPGQIPEEFNPTASYITYFTVPESFRGKRIFLSFQGVESSFRLWINGTYTGFSSDTFTPSEFEITDLLKDGENKLAVQVYKWYSGSWLEDQDFFRFSGIFRDVYLFAAPKHHVWDVKVNADYDPQHPETGRIEARFDCLEGAGRISAELFSPAGDLLETKTVQVSSECRPGKKNPSKAGGFPADVSFDIPSPLLWSAEKPQLYKLKVTVKDENDKTEEWFCQYAGIRHFEMSGNLMKLNGRRIVIKGVNRHEFSADGGRVVSVSELLQDLYNMKRSNINAIRLSHYPNSSPIYELADILGFYLIGECNMETHGTWDMTERGLKDESYIVPGKNTQYMFMLLDRIHSMYQRDKNHPSILIWSCGNESCGGPVIHEMSRELKKLDKTRLVHYEGIFHDRSFPATSDMESQMYTPVAGIKEFLSQHREKPFICCEYMHAMGNSCGALYKYTDLTDEDELYQGGFIWDYIDQAIREKDRYGNEYMAYGGDHLERPNDGNFSGDGLVYADRSPSPKLAEVKYCYQNISVTFAQESFGAGKTGEFTVVNKNLFTSTEDFNCFAILEKDGEMVQCSSVSVSVPALSQETLELPFAVPAEPGEYAVTVSFRLKNNTAWAEAGYEIAFGQQAVRVEGPLQKTPSEGFDPLRIINGSYNTGVKGSNFDVLFSKLYGGLVSYRYKGKELLSGMVRPNFWRAPVDNDNGCMMPFRSAQWKTAGMYADHKNPADMGAYFRLENPQISREDDKVKIVYTYYLPTVPMHSCTLNYLVSEDGTVETSLEYQPPAEGFLPDFPEFSVMFKLDADYDRMEWFGTGPQDSYPDRKKGAKLGIYTSRVCDTQARYLVPQESGSHADVRWMKVTDSEGTGLFFDCRNLSVSVSPYTPHELENALHPTELPPVHYTYVRVGQQSGIGGDDSWGSQPYEEFLLRSSEPRKISFCFKGI